MNVAILYTGGTIGCVGSPLVPLPEGRFEAAFHDIIAPIIHSQYPACTLSFIPFGTALDSTHLQPSDWCSMALDILPHYNTYDGFVVLHGTDTMAYTASALSFLFTGLQKDGFPRAVLSKPVVLTGSQVPLFFEDAETGLSLLFNTDALQNICGAIAAAQSGIPEVCLYFNDRLFRGNRTVKTNANEFHAFSSPNYPDLGAYGVEFSIENDHILHLPTTREISLDSAGAQDFVMAQLEYLSKHIGESIVISFPAFPAFYDADAGAGVLADMLAAITDHMNVDGIVLESYGEGNFPSGNPNAPHLGAIYRALKSASEKGITLIDCTQVLDAVVDAGAYASGSWLAEVGVAGAFDMTPIAALTKLIYLTSLRNFNGNEWDAFEITRLMQTNIIGEMMDVNRLDTRGKWYIGAGESIEAFDGSAILVNDFAAGPILKDAAGQILWRPLQNPRREKMPGRLYMQGDGNLVFFDNSNVAAWASNTGTTGPATSMLILDGKTSDLGVRLYIYNYARGEISKVLFADYGAFSD